MSQYSLYIPQFIDSDVKEIYVYLSGYGYGRHTAEKFLDELEKKQEQIKRYPFSCAVDTVYPALIEMSVRKAVLWDGRYLMLYIVEDKTIVIVMVERAERDYITTFDANLKLYEEEKQRNG